MNKITPDAHCQLVISIIITTYVSSACDFDKDYNTRELQSD